MNQRIAFVSTLESGPWGGSEELWSRTAMRLLSQGRDVLACVKKWPDLPPPLRALHTAGGRIVFWESFVRFPERLAKKLWGDPSYRWLDRFRPDLVVISHAMMHRRTLACMEACLKRGIRYVLVCHGMSPHFWPQDDWVFDYARACSRAQVYCFLSQANLELARLQLADPLTNAEIVRNPFNVSYDARPPWPCNGAVWKLACVARLFPAQKGQDLLFEVLRMPKWRERPLRVTLYGEGVQRKGLEALKKMWELDQVEFGGFVSDLESVWAAHHGVVLPSRTEGLPLALVEAMLCGRPAIVTDVAGGELVEDGISGFIANAPSVEDLDVALERAWQRREDWQRMGERAARRVRELVPRDPAEVFAGKLLELLPRHGHQANSEGV